MPRDTDLQNRFEHPTPPGRPAGPGDSDVGSMTPEQKFTRALQLTAPKLGPEFAEEFAQLLSPTTLAILVSALVAYAAMHVFVVGWVVDIIGGIFLFFGLALSAKMLWDCASDFYYFVSKTNAARTLQQLDQASQHLANLIAVVGVGILFLLITRRGKPMPAKAAAGAALGSLALNARKAGMTTEHANAFLRAAKQLQARILVRCTNPKSLQWIERNYPAKPISIKAKTSPDTGIVMVGKDPAKLAQETQEALSAGYYIVGEDLIARGAGGRVLQLPKTTDWPLQPNQIICPRTSKPLVGDYDLLGVVDVTAPGRNISLATSNGVPMLDRSSPRVKRAADLVNQMIGGEKRVMHGAHDQFAALEKAGDGAIVFDPDGTSTVLATVDEMRTYYATVLGGRQTAAGAYPRLSLEEAKQLANTDNVIFVDFGGQRTWR